MRRDVRLALLLFLLFFTLTPFLCAQDEARSLNHSIASVSIGELGVPAKAWKHFGRARSLALSGKNAEARREIDKAIEIAPRFADAYLLRSDREIAAHEFQAAIDDILTAQKIEPGVTWSRVLMACAYNGLKRYDDAYTLLSNLQGPEAASWQARYELARAEVGRNDVEGALHWSELALAGAPVTFLDAHLLRSNALQLAKRWQEATHEMEVYLASPGPQAHRAAVLAAIERMRTLADKELAQNDPIVTP